MPAVTILDGGLGRELTHQGATLRQPEWSAGPLIETPEIVQKAHEAFLRAGAEVLTTNSYALVPFHIGEARFAAQGRALAECAGQLARAAVQAVAPSARVAGALPPPCGSYLPERFDAAEAARILAPLAAGMAPHVDLWLAETQSSLAEARASAEAVAGSDKPLWLAFSLRDGPEDATAARLRSGEPVAAAAALARDLGAQALLFNCSMPEVMQAALVAARDVLGDSLPLGVYANAFCARGTDGAANETLAEVREDLTPARYPLWCDDWIAAGATLIGGCCGIGPAHIAALRDRYKG